MGDPLHRDFELGGWLVQPSLNTICRQTTTVHLRPKLMELLELLALYEGRVAGKEEIFRKVWHGECVVESVLGRSIADLRRLLGDDAATPRYIRTVPRRGYRLVAPVCWRESETRAGAGPSIAVLPFADLAPAGDQQYLCDGLAEELTNSLCGVPGLSVIARTSAFSFRDKAFDVREIGRQP